MKVRAAGHFTLAGHTVKLVLLAVFPCPCRARMAEPAEPPRPPPPPPLPPKPSGPPKPAVPQWAKRPEGRTPSIGIYSEGYPHPKREPQGHGPNVPGAGDRPAEIRGGRCFGPSLRAAWPRPPLSRRLDITTHDSEGDGRLRPRPGALAADKMNAELTPPTGRLGNLACLVWSRLTN